jgi:MscS family membrane protein
MRLKVKVVVRCYVLVLSGLLLWSIWAAAQGAGPENTPSTNAPSVIAASETDKTEKDQGERKAWLTFGLDKVGVLKREIPAGIPLWQYLASLIYVFLAFCAAKFFDLMTGVYLKQWAQSTKTTLDDLVVSMIKGPVKVVSFVVLLYVGLEIFDWPALVKTLLKKGLMVVVAISLTYLAAKLIDVLMSYWRARTPLDADKGFNEQLFPLVRKALKFFVVIVSVLVTSQNLGINITGLLATVSIGGLALGLAAQDTVANLFGAVAVFVDKPFRVGDRIKLDTIDGTVESIGLRSTRVRHLDGYLITVPNKTMGNATITNLTQRANIKSEMNIGLTYDTSAEKVRRAVEILREIYERHPMTFEVSITFNKFADSALNISVVHWWKSTDVKAHNAGMEEMNLAVKRRFDEEEINFAFPSQTVYLKQDSEWRLKPAAAESNHIRDEAAPGKTI